VGEREETTGCAGSPCDDMASLGREYYSGKPGNTDRLDILAGGFSPVRPTETYRYKGTFGGVA
jgi:hypothetical protein